MSENFNVFDFQLWDDDLTRIAGMDTGQSLFFDHRDPERATRLARFRLS
jgi:2,5-diketo-D-gluconate reductase A